MDADRSTHGHDNRITHHTRRDTRWRIGGNGPQATERLEVLRTIETVRDADLPRATSAAPPVVPRHRVEMLNRMVNILLAIIALIALSPILILVALLVRLSSRGPVLYTQTRVGLDRRSGRVIALYDRRERNQGGRIFTIFKFRSMYADAERHTGAVWATQRDPRITPVGRILRQYRLDELPQLVNVVRGDMNIVGPRPERPSIFAQLRQNIQEYPLRQRARPGITGWAQINQAYDSSIDDVRSKVQFDLEYLERQSVMEDLKIMARTLPVMIFKRGAC